MSRQLSQESSKAHPVHPHLHYTDDSVNYCSFLNVYLVDIQQSATLSFGRRSHKIMRGQAVGRAKVQSKYSSVPSRDRVGVPSYGSRFVIPICQSPIFCSFLFLTNRVVIHDIIKAQTFIITSIVQAYHPSVDDSLFGTYDLSATLIS